MKEKTVKCAEDKIDNIKDFLLEIEDKIELEEFEEEELQDLCEVLEKINDLLWIYT
ncbi:hypothetical protein [Pseudoleptotrichia goodfellowii]|uniref:Uncharacterized protein n=1 Tax=Pseudoleptotrichia goodfellowii TaxID=157692 RepID=A0A510J7Y0_9FUSO|nr:hypothetical protein [Pseudoleptotrichia goodfellowii]BBM35400.1 hypothetical protein JCM16774_0312 [Pseudoleptotrichia goodfellowii]